MGAVSRPRGKRLTVAERETLKERSLALSIQGKTDTEIASELGIYRKTASRLIREKLAESAKHRDQDRERALARYEAIIRGAWERLDLIRCDSGSPGVAGILNAIRAAQARIDKLTGVEDDRYSAGTPREYVVVWEDIPPHELAEIEAEAAAKEREASQADKDGVIEVEIDPARGPDD